MKIRAKLITNPEMKSEFKWLGYSLELNLHDQLKSTIAEMEKKFATTRNLRFKIYQFTDDTYVRVPAMESIQNLHCSLR